MQILPRVSADLRLFFLNGCRSGALKYYFKSEYCKTIQQNTVLCYYATECCLYYCTYRCNIAIIWVVYTNHCLLPSWSAL